MLKNLEIHNVALIDNVNLEFSPNLNVLSGETGAGKSIIVDALNFVIGAKQNKGLIKQGKPFMKVQALFSSPFSKDIHTLLTDYDIEDQDEILIMRKLTSEGKNDIKLNGTTITLNMLKNLTSLLIDIHGQHEHQHLLKDKFHLQIVDIFIKDKSIFTEYEEKLNNLKNIQLQIKKLNGSTENQERMLDLLDYQIKEIEQAKLVVGEDDELLQKKVAMLNYEKIYESLTTAINEIDGQNSTINSIKKAQLNLNNITKFDETLLEITNRIESTKFELIDISETLKVKKEECSFNQSEFNEIDERLDKIKLIKKKYGATIEDVLKYLEKSKQEYETILNSKSNLVKCFEQKKVILKEIFTIANKISNIRRQLSKNFEYSVKTELSSLGMKDADFKVYFSDFVTEDTIENKLTPTGCDEVKFLFSANAGQSLKPLSEIISGGEASRFMLALKNILAEVDEISSMVFDEIDTGISGDMGYQVACKLANISKTHQVMSVSHLPQICAMADKNIKIEKYTKDNETFVNARNLNSNETLLEIARLSGGTQDSSVSLEHAKELKNRCNAYKS